MGAFIAGIRLIGGPLPFVVFTLAGIALAVLVIRRLPRSSRWVWIRRILLAGAIGAALGLIACWLVGDVVNAFDITLTGTTRAWVAGTTAACAIAIATAVRVRRARTGRARRVGAILAVPLFLFAGAAGINAEFGQYTTIGSITGATVYPPLPDAIAAAQRAGSAGSLSIDTQLWRTWTAPADLPAHGLVGAITIPGTVSGFPARQGLVYLPPAALVPDPPALPVLIMLSGQPGSPENVFQAGHLDQVVDGIASAQGGLAPIVVVPDQLSASNVNPMCVDSAIGESATYLTVDVPRWITQNLHVQTGATAWAIGGFSEGGTCSIQLGAGHPELFGSILDVSGELEPKIGSAEQTIAAGFAGDPSAYEAAKPVSILAKKAPYPDTEAVFAVGALDAKYGAWANTIATAASDAGMSATVLVSPGTAHDWGTVRYALVNGLPAIYRQMGLAAPTS